MRLWSFGPEGPSDFDEKPAEAKRAGINIRWSFLWKKNGIRLWHCLRCGRKGRKPQHFCGDTSLNARQDCYCSAVDCLHEATRFELEHGRLRIAVRLCPFHFEELTDLVKRQGKDWSETRGKYDWLESRLWAASQGLKSGL
jgi:hypothetical protein